MKKKWWVLAGIVILLAVILLVLGSKRTCIGCNEPPKYNESCISDADCVASTCCHASECVTKWNAPDCSGILCTQECAPNTLDCGQGSCKCIDNKCKAVIG